MIGQDEEMHIDVCVCVEISSEVARTAAPEYCPGHRGHVGNRVMDIKNGGSICRSTLSPGQGSIEKPRKQPMTLTEVTALKEI